MSPELENVPELAFYYPGHLWRSSDWLKTLLLFFDGVGLLIPKHKQGEPEKLDQHLAVPLRERGLLHYLIADEVVNEEVTKRLADAVTELVNSGVLDSLAKDGTGFHALSMSRMGFYGNREIAESLLQKLSNRGLASKSQDGKSIPLHPSVRHLILVLLAQIIRSHNAPAGFELSPATDQMPMFRALTEVLALPTGPSVANVIEFDIQSVTVDLSAIPLDEVLDYRKENLGLHRNYVRSVRRFTRELSFMAEKERLAAFTERQEELNDVASGLRAKAKTAWKQPASFAIGLAGAGWTLATGNPIGAILAASSLVLKGPGFLKPDSGPFSYLFGAHERYS